MRNARRHVVYLNGKHKGMVGSKATGGLQGCGSEGLLRASIVNKEPPYAEPHVRWCERSENESRKETTSFSSYSIGAFQPLRVSCHETPTFIIPKSHFPACKPQVSKPQIKAHYLATKIVKTIHIREHPRRYTATLSHFEKRSLKKGNI